MSPRKKPAESEAPRGWGFHRDGRFTQDGRHHGQATEFMRLAVRTRRAYHDLSPQAFLELLGQLSPLGPIDMLGGDQVLAWRKLVDVGDWPGAPVGSNAAATAVKYAGFSRPRWCDCGRAHDSEERCACGGSRTERDRSADLQQALDAF